MSIPKQGKKKGGFMGEKRREEGEELNMSEL
jgi:hypothetical protein